MKTRFRWLTKGWVTTDWPRIRYLHQLGKAPNVDAHLTLRPLHRRGSNPDDRVGRDGGLLKFGQFLAVSFKFGWRCHQRPQRLVGTWHSSPT